MDTRILHTKIWDDHYFAELESEEKLVFIYLLTNDKVNIIHCYEIIDKQIQNDTGVNKEVLDRCKWKFEETGKIYFKDGFVFLANAHKYEDYSGPSNETAKEKTINRMNPLIREWYLRMIEEVSGQGCIDRGVATPTIIHNTEIISNNKEIRKSKNIEKKQTPSQRMGVFIKLVNNKDERYEELIASLKEKGIPEEVAIQELHKFIDYWTELNKSGTKERWQTEKTFEVNRRLMRWFDNIKQFKRRQKGIKI